MTYIVNIFELVNQRLLAVQFDGESTDAFDVCFSNWSDVEYLEAYFNEREHILQNDYWGGISVEEAVLKTLELAKDFEDIVFNAAETDIEEDNLEESLFVPIGSKNTTINHIKSKAYGGGESWLRLYGIRIDYNLYVVTGGGIKLVEFMSEDNALIEQLDRLEIAKEYLKEIGFDSDTDYDFIEIQTKDE